jgi:hypothetical protein
MAIRKTPVATSPTPGSTSFCLLSVQNHHIPAAPACHCGFLHHVLCKRSLVTTTNLLLQEVSSLVLLDNHSNIPTMGTSRCTISHRDFSFLFFSETVTASQACLLG